MISTNNTLYRVKADNYWTIWTSKADAIHFAQYLASTIVYNSIVVEDMEGAVFYGQEWQ